MTPALTGFHLATTRSGVTAKADFGVWQPDSADSVPTPCESGLPA